MAAEGGALFALEGAADGFNGAAAGWPRKVPLAVFGLCRLLEELQWGRGRMAAEGTITGAGFFRNDRLQWGRGRMAAEGCEQ